MYSLADQERLEEDCKVKKNGRFFRPLPRLPRERQEDFDDASTNPASILAAALSSSVSRHKEPQGFERTREQAVPVARSTPQENSPNEGVGGGGGNQLPANGEQCQVLRKHDICPDADTIASRHSSFRSRGH